MKNIFTTILVVLCAALLLCVYTCALASSAATPTDLQPATQTDLEPDWEEEEDSGVEAEEMLITKSLKLGETWEGKMKKTKPAVLKLDVPASQRVYMIVEGIDVWVAVERADRPAYDPTRKQTDPETHQAVVSWNAEPGGYLIVVGPVEPNLLGMAKVTCLNEAGYAAWEAENETPQEEETLEEEDIQIEPVTDYVPEIIEPETPENPEPEGETPAEDENEPKSDLSHERYIKIDVTYDVEEPVIGDTAHFKANLFGYEGLKYTMQWQYSPDDYSWYDIPNATQDHFSIVVDEENNLVYWRILVYIER